MNRSISQRLSFAFLLTTAAAFSVDFVACSPPKDESQPEYWVDRLEREETREEALQKLGEMKDVKALPGINQVLAKPGPGRAQAAQALSAIGSQESIPPLLAALDFDTTGSDEVVKDRNHANEKILNALTVLQAKDVAGPAQKLLASKDVYVRVAAVRALGQAGATAAVPALSDIIRQDDNVRLKGAAAVALGNIGAPEGVPVLIEAMFMEKGGSIYPEASFALMQIGPPAIPGLVDALNGKNPAVQKMAEKFVEGAVVAKCVEVLGDLHAKSQEDTLIKLFKDAKNPIIQRNIALALAQLGGPKSAEVLGKASVEPASDLREFYVDALNELSDRSSVPVLLADAKTSDEEARYVAFRALSRLGDGRDVVAAQAIANGKDGGKRFADEMPRLLAAKECGDNGDCWVGKLKDKNPKVRDRAAYALGRLGDKKATAPLAAALADDNLETRYAIMWALGRLNDRTALPECEKLLKAENGKSQFVPINEYLKRLIVQLKRA